MSLMNEYIKKRWGSQELQHELQVLIKKYNDKKRTYLIVHAAATGKPIPFIGLNDDDYYVIFDILRHVKSKNLDYYIETPGGNADVVAEIVRFLRSKFENVHFVVSGQAKSAGTILVLSGDEIMMSKSGSLGPIDAQIRIGRSQISAYDYMEWIRKKREEAEKMKKLNPLDATMVAQISPGEIGLVDHALKFAKDLVVEWLPKYKFKNWNVTEDRKMPVTDGMKQERAGEIAEALMDRSKWRTHGRSIKIEDLENIVRLKIKKLDDNPQLAEIVYRIQTVIWLLLSSTSIYKTFVTADKKLFSQAVPVSSPPKIPKRPVGKADAVEIGIKCPKCGKTHTLYAKFSKDSKIDGDFQKRGCKPFPKENKLKCGCGFEIDLSGIRNQLELETDKKVVL